MSIQQFMEALEYRLNEAWEHQWPSYPNGQVIGFTNDYASVQLCFNRETQEVIEITALSELEASSQHAYRYINPDYKAAIKAESESRKVPFDQALEDISYVDLEVIEDILEKGVAMLADEAFDKRVTIPLDISDEELLTICKAAHSQDITLNQFIENALTEVIKRDYPDFLEN